MSGGRDAPALSRARRRSPGRERPRHLSGQSPLSKTKSVSRGLVAWQTRLAVLSYRLAGRVSASNPNQTTGGASLPQYLLSDDTDDGIGPPSITMDPLVAHGVGRRFRRGGHWAIRDVDLAISRGSITALVGPNGAGKSTLIRTWLGFERPDEGRVLVEGVDPRRDRTAAVRRIGYVPQSASLYRDLTVDDHIRFADLHRPGFDSQHALQRVLAVGIQPRRRVGDLSGGEQAQVALAIALGTRSPILLLDEPLASLDPLARREFLTVLVDDIRANEATAVLSSHVVTDIEQACDSLVVLASGHVALHATVATAKAMFRTVTLPSPSEIQVIGKFSGPSGEALGLVGSNRPDLPGATLEEVVLGHLAAARLQRTTSGRAA